MGSESLRVDLDGAGGCSPAEAYDARLAKLREIIGKDARSVLDDSDVFVEDLDGEKVRWVKMKALYHSDKMFSENTSLDDLVVMMWNERVGNCASLFFFKEFYYTHREQQQQEAFPGVVGQEQLSAGGRSPVVHVYNAVSHFNG